MGSAASGNKHQRAPHEIKSRVPSPKECFDQRFRNPIKNNATMSDFELRSKLGEGGYGNVVLVVKKSNDVLYAMKLIAKKRIISTNDLKRIVNERNILQAVDFPFIIQYDSSFKTKAYLHLTMSYASGGTLLDLMVRLERLNEDHARFYAGQIVLALEYLHGLDIVFRDVKLENLVLDERGYLRLIDFGLAEITQGRILAVCGTEVYMAPEMLLRHGYKTSVDWWAFGVLLYVMIEGKFPFTIGNKVRISKYYVKFSQNVSVQAKEFLSELLIKDASKRLGAQSGARDIKKHKWFQQTNWSQLLHKEVEPHFRPASPSSTENIGAFERQDFEKEPEYLNDKFNEF